MDNAEKLLELARGKFGALSGAEEKLFRAVANGDTADYSAGKEEDNDPAKAKDWGEERRLKADRIAWLCTDRQAKEIVAKNGIEVQGAFIEGELDLMFAKISFPLSFYRSAFRDEIYMGDAEIHALNLGGSHTGNIKADGLKVKCGVYLRNGFKVEGEVRLVGARIGGDLDCSNGQFVNGGAETLSADKLKVMGDVFFCDGFKAEGEVRLLSARIGGGLDCGKGQFINKGAMALQADRLKVEDNVFLRNGFKAEGEVCINGAVIEGHFVWRTDSADAILDMRSAKIGTLWDDENSWPAKGKLFLNGLVYDKIYDYAVKDAKSRIEWLHRQGDEQFRPQPYEQLAEALRKGGQDEDAREVLIQKNKDKARLTKLTFGELLWYRFFGPVIGYGYRPLGALKWIALFIVLGWAVFGSGFSAGVMKSTKEIKYTAEGVGAGYEMPGNSFGLQTLVYSIDMFVPVIDLYEANRWLPDAKAKGEAKVAMVKLKAAEKDGVKKTCIEKEYIPVAVSGFFVLGYMWFHIIMGWVFTTLFVLGLTKLVRT